MTENWLAWALLAAAFAALTAVLSKLGLRNVDPDAAQLVRTAVVVLTLAAVMAAAGKVKGFGNFTRQNWTYLALAGLATAASWACYFRALKFGDAARVAAVDKLSVVMVAIFALIVLGERLGPAGWTGVALAGLGAVLLSLGR